jgi:SH3 domain-containing YSC84-like protein 1
MFSQHKLAISAAVLSFALAGPALADNNSNATNAQKVVAGATQDIHNLSANQNFTNLLKRAKGVFIIPSFFKGAFVVGGSGGTGVLLAHDNGHWSDPAFLTLGSVSIGAQAGAKGGTLVMFLMTDKAVADFTQTNNFSLNANSSLAVIKWSPAAQGSAGKGDVIIWSGANGVFAGLDVSGADIHADTGYDKAYYNNKLTNTKQIIQSQISPASASKLMTELPS